MLSCIPNIVYSNKWTGQTSAISSTTILTPPADGLYRVSTAIVASGTVGAGTVHVAIQPIGESVSNTIGDAPLGGEFVLAGQSGVAISISTSISGTVSSYDLYVTLEQLQ